MVVDRVVPNRSKVRNDPKLARIKHVSIECQTIKRRSTNILDAILIGKAFQNKAIYKLFRPIDFQNFCSLETCLKREGIIVPFRSTLAS